MTSQSAAIGFWKTVVLLLKASRTRANGRQRRQQQLLNNRGASNWSPLAMVFAVIVMGVLNGVAAFAVIGGVEAGQRLDIERQGKIVVSNAFLRRVQVVENITTLGPNYTSIALEDYFAEEAKHIAEKDGGREADVENRLRAAVAASGSRDLIAWREAEAGIGGVPVRSAAMLGSLGLVWWFAMLICQGEGIELDLQRRRHPMWEWLFSHPVGGGAVFFAEMLSPLAANPVYWTVPVFVAVLYGFAQGPLVGLWAAAVLGIPLAIAAACVGKALEIGAILRLPARSRGAVIGILSWFGFASMIAMFFASRFITPIALFFGDWVEAAARLPWPLLRLFLGMAPDGTFSFARGMAFCWSVSALLIAVSVVFCARSIRNGLSGAFASDNLAVRHGTTGKFGSDPLFRKEYLWFLRDRSAIVQTILIPVTVAGFQLFNFRGFFEHAGDAWNYLCGVAIFFGTYFLWVLGPKSLASEGAALWIALTWPRGLESMLKAKARLWSLIATGLVMIILLWACWSFPQQSWKILLVAVGWYAFSRSMAEKAVTLVTVTSESGEAQKVSSGRRWAAQLGMLTFAIGICTEQWHLAIVGVVYSWITAAAMWENLRARLPYLYDPWSEVLPAPPTLMHAMVGISVLVECASVMTALFLQFFGTASLAIAQSLGYAICAVGVSIGVAHFLLGRGVSPAQVWNWREEEGDREEAGDFVRQYIAADRDEARWLLFGLGGGALLGLFAHLYMMAIRFIPSIGGMMEASERDMHGIPGMVTAYAVMAILFAPFAEEYLFRGLLFRALDRHWGGWKAVLGAAAFFAIYHTPLAWLPVGLLGVANCLLFKKSGRLAPAILLHMAYNTVVTLWI